jgi:hypothetical protein
MCGIPMPVMLLGLFVQLRTAPINFLISVRLSVRLSTCISLAPTGQISVKFDIGDIY